MSRKALDLTNKLTKVVNDAERKRANPELEDEGELADVKSTAPSLSDSKPLNLDMSANPGETVHLDAYGKKVKSSEDTTTYKYKNKQDLKKVFSGK